ncbi:(E)-4-hydroxy-3-methylbut-2-enyl-diphosphate synthase [uncultured Muribaculum sp.]|uniref:(E)-4-hydroxy-3-methylbut-2-enyl-diphosphate synthase n=1 Tax=uncultured Muribaculum sp. TaxID=1918613 RepID=UPI0025982F3E|nr:(E)-4-hydroxy-3-methylbut-2-enyl-diphosphate synthase [uncultured Muribaculum sp.]
MSVFDYARRTSRAVNIGGVPLGGDNPIRLQSMTNTSTLDTAGSVEQTVRIASAGADYVRLTAQGVREAQNIGVIRQALRDRGVTTPLVADIHFNPRAAFAAAEVTDKVRINPGNFVDPGRTFKKLEYTDEEYAAELKRIEEAFTPFLDLCKAHGTAIRIGVNHGSLSDRIMSRYGDTPAGMVESAMEFLRVAVKHGFFDIVISIKASNVTVMVETVRRLVAAMESENMDFPLHLGVTEAGDGEDGRVKSAVGIGALLSQGIGDTIRVSLSEAPENEIPVAEALVEYISRRAGAPSIPGEYYPGFNSVMPEARMSLKSGSIGGGQMPAVIAPGEMTLSDYVEADAMTPVDEVKERLKDKPGSVIVVTTSHENRSGAIMAMIHALTAAGINNPVIPCIDYGDAGFDAVALMAAVDFGAILLNGFRDGIWIKASALTGDELLRLSLGILQAARLRISKTEYIACPGCGRTLFDLQSTLKAVKEATSHLKGLKIGVMGCIVNGPGEMADADYGYVGAAAGNISLYKGKVCVEKNIPQAEAIPHLVKLIKDSGDWQEP